MAVAARDGEEFVVQSNGGDWWWQFDREHVKALEEVGAELPLLPHLRPDYIRAAPPMVASPRPAFLVELRFLLHPNAYFLAFTRTRSFRP
jgi:hypothetical protein